MSNFDQALNFTLPWEGGAVNNPHDPGGATNRGITQRTYNEWRITNGLPPQSVLKSTLEEAKSIYKEDYWDVIKGDEISYPLSVAVFDFAVNSGPKRAIRYLQLTKDVNKYIDLREKYLRSLPTSEFFLKGWLNRLNDLRRFVKDAVG